VLNQLDISNIVLIDQVSLSFERGLCVLTGETGAGKSIMLDALGLVLGNRSDSGLIRREQAQAQVSAVFDITANEEAKKEMEVLGLEVGDELIIRRTLTADGKGKCFINDQAVSVAALKQLAPTLVEIHGQHDQRGLFDTANHRRLVDEYGQHQSLLQEVAVCYEAWQSAEHALADAKAAIEKARKEEEYLRHIVADLGALKPVEGEEETLSDRRTRMMQSEKLFAVLNDALAELMKDGGASATLRSVQRTLMRSNLTQTPRFEAIVEMLDNASELAANAEEELERIGKEADYNPKELEEMEERLFSLRAAARKYQVDADSLPDVLNGAQEALRRLSHDEKELNANMHKCTETKAAYKIAAEKLTIARKKTALKLEKVVLKELAPLKMEHTAFRIHIEEQAEMQWNRYGMDNVAMQVATNVTKGANPSFAPLQKIASGGELSRFMLALKVALSDVRSTPTMIFDEIDTGTGGAVADAIGKRLSQLGEASQVLVVTHLPQVAARGNQHLVVSKSTKSKQVVTKIQVLEASERREELARMLAGETITAEARKAADKLLEHAA
jgi:DNA repair protein RecN (Recombination protein N)